jgi:hypothetical protein
MQIDVPEAGKRYAEVITATGSRSTSTTFTSPCMPPSAMLAIDVHDVHVSLHASICPALFRRERPVSTTKLEPRRIRRTIFPLRQAQARPVLFAMAVGTPGHCESPHGAPTHGAPTHQHLAALLTKHACRRSGSCMRCPATQVASLLEDVQAGRPVRTAPSQASTSGHSASPLSPSAAHVLFSGAVRGCCCAGRGWGRGEPAMRAPHAWAPMHDHTRRRVCAVPPPLQPPLSPSKNRSPGSPISPFRRSMTASSLKRVRSVGGRCCMYV